MGPDEFLLMALEEDAATVEAGLRKLCPAGISSLVDISHRQIGLVLEGRLAARWLPARFCADSLSGRNGSADDFSEGGGHYLASGGNALSCRDLAFFRPLSYRPCRQCFGRRKWPLKAANP